MAKKVKAEDVVERDIFINTIKSGIVLHNILKELKQDFIDILKTTKEQAGNNPFTGYGDINKFLKDQQKAKASIEQINKLEKEELSVKEQLAFMTDQEAKAKIKYNEANKEQARVLRTVAKEELGLLSLYEKESIRLNDLRKKYKDLSLAKKETTAEGIKLKNEITNLDRKLKDVDASTGQFTRNVGGYTNGFSKFYGALRTAANIIPGLGISGILLLGWESFIKLWDTFTASVKINTVAIDENHEAVVKLIEARDALRKSTEEAIQRQLVAEGKLTKFDVQRVRAYEEFQEATLKAQNERDKELIKRAEQLGIVLKKGEYDLVIDYKKTTLEKIKNDQEFYRQKEALDALNWVNERDRAKLLAETIRAINEESFAEEQKKKIKRDISGAAMQKKELGTIQELITIVDKYFSDLKAKQSGVISKTRENVATAQRIRLLQIQKDGILAGKSEIEIQKQVSEKKMEILRNELLDLQTTAERKAEIELELAELRKGLRDQEFKEEATFIKNTLSTYTLFLDKKRQAQISALDDEIEKRKDNVSTQERLAIAGQENTLAFEKREQAKAEAEKKRLQKEEEKRQKRLMYYKAFSAFLENADKNEAASAAAKALSQVVLADIIAGSFKDGVEDFKGKGTGTSDSNIVRISKGESVTTAKGTEKYPGLATAINNLEAEKWFIENALPELSGNKISVNSNEDVVNELRKLNKATENKPEFNIHWPSMDTMIEEKIERGYKKVIRHVNSKPRI